MLDALMFRLLACMPRRGTGRIARQESPLILNHLHLQNPHTHSGVLRIEDLIFGFVRLASLKYKKQADVVARFDRLLRKHLIPLALGEKPDVLTEAGLGNIDEVVQPQQQRAVLKLFMKFSGADAPEQALTGSGFMEAIKSLNLPPPGTSDEYLITVLEQCHKLYSRLRNAEPTDAGPQEDVLQREVLRVPCRSPVLNVTKCFLLSLLCNDASELAPYMQLVISKSTRKTNRANHSTDYSVDYEDCGRRARLLPRRHWSKGSG